MIGVLRFIRAVCGLVFGWQLVGLIPTTDWLNYVNQDPGGALAIMLAKGLVMSLFGGLFFWLRSRINRMHEREHGEPHPALVKPWAI